MDENYSEKRLKKLCEGIVYYSEIVSDTIMANKWELSQYDKDFLRYTRTCMQEDMYYYARKILYWIRSDMEAYERDFRSLAYQKNESIFGPLVDQCKNILTAVDNAVAELDVDDCDYNLDEKTLKAWNKNEKEFEDIMYQLFTRTKQNCEGRSELLDLACLEDYILRSNVSDYEDEEAMRMVSEIQKMVQRRFFIFSVSWFPDLFK